MPMKNYKSEKHALFLSRTENLLSADHLCRTIDIPLEQAAREYESNATEAHGYNTSAEFIEQLAAYVQHLYAHGCRTPCKLDSTRAEIQVVFLLERDYQSLSGRGYEAALLDSTQQGNEGLFFVRNFLLDALKQEQRRKYMNWVLTCSVSHLDWWDKVSLTRLLLERLQQSGCEMPDWTRPERFAEYARELLLEYVSAVTKYRDWLRKS